MNEDWSINMDRLEVKLPENILHIQSILGLIKAIERDFSALMSRISSEEDTYDETNEVDKMHRILKELRTEFETRRDQSLKAFLERGI